MIEELHHLILKNGYRFFNNLELKAGEIYTAEQFSSIPEQRMESLIIGRIIYRGSLLDVESKRKKLFGIKDEKTIENMDNSKKEANKKAAK